MTREECKQRVYKVITTVLDVKPEEIQEKHSFTGNLGADSIKSMNLVASFEEEFDIEMDEDQALEVNNVGRAIDFILKYL
ncbi:MAG: acyl carrier protein [Planctomycetota bacterium]